MLVSQSSETPWRKSNCPARETSWKGLEIINKSHRLGWTQNSTHSYLISGRESLKSSSQETGSEIWDLYAGDYQEVLPRTTLTRDKQSRMSRGRSWTMIQLQQASFRARTAPEHCPILSQRGRTFILHHRGAFGYKHAVGGLPPTTRLHPGKVLRSVAQHPLSGVSVKHILQLIDFNSRHSQQNCWGRKGLHP